MNSVQPRAKIYCSYFFELNAWFFFSWYTMTSKHIMTGFYAPCSHDQVSNHLKLLAESLPPEPNSQPTSNELSLGNRNRCPVPGVLYNMNTLESFHALDRQSLLKSEAKKVLYRKIHVLLSYRILLSSFVLRLFFFQFNLLTLSWYFCQFVLSVLMSWFLRYGKILFLAGPRKIVLFFHVSFWSHMLIWKSGHSATGLHFQV